MLLQLLGMHWNGKLHSGTGRSIRQAGQGRAGMSAPRTAAPEPQPAEPSVVMLHPRC